MHSSTSTTTSSTPSSSSPSSSRPPIPRPPPNSTPTTTSSRSCKEWLFQCSGRRGSTSSIQSATLPTKLPSSKQGPTKPPPPFPRPSTSTSTSTSTSNADSIINHPKLPVNSANHPPSTVPRQPRGVSMTRARPPSVTIIHDEEYSHHPIETPPSRTTSEVSEYTAAPFSINIIPPTPKHQPNKPPQRQMSLSITRSRVPIDEEE